MGFPLDEFQEEALDALDGGESVLVSAPTGSGKTIVAQYALERALVAGTKAFYTTPLKALSNQKHGELAATYGAERVGLLTGDTSRNPRAPIVVMTTEVLRNMLFARSGLLDGLAAVVLDEVHYLQDPYRGSVWEEILILAPPGVTFVCLSASVSNAAELGRWLTSVRGPTRVVITRHRPVPLHHHFAVSERGREGVRVMPLLRHGRPNPDGLALDRRGGRPAPRGRYGAAGSRYRVPRRHEVVEHLAAVGQLPAIIFIFSRAGCDDAARQCLHDGLRLTSSEQRGQVRAILEEHVDELTDDDLRALGYGTWSEAMEAGIGTHHAGLVPAFREATEACFSAGLLGVVFATETLALGINMPARSVVVERLTKFRGAERSPLTSGEYLQLTGRAGRRGIDPVGHATILWSPGVSFADAARVATAPPPDLRSSFRPTYNLTANLVRRWSEPEAHRLLDSSFAQWQADHATPAASGAGRTAEPASGARRDVDAATPGTSRREMLVERFERRLRVLSDRGYVDGWSLTDNGERLATLYHESDLLVAEALHGGLFDDLQPPVLAGVVSAFTYEARRADEAPERIPDRLLARRLDGVARLGEQLRAVETARRVARTRRPDPGLATGAYWWAKGVSLSTVLERVPVAPGDFVRNIRQLVDLLRQIAQVAPRSQTMLSADMAVSGLRRGVVAAESSFLEADRPGGSSEPGEPEQSA